MKRILKLVVDNGARLTEMVVPPRLVRTDSSDIIDHVPYTPDYEFRRAERLLEEGFNTLDLFSPRLLPGCICSR